MSEVKKSTTIIDNLMGLKRDTCPEILSNSSGLLGNENYHLCSSDLSKDIISTTIPISEQSFSVDPNTLKFMIEHGSPLVFLIVLCWFFKILTRFIEVCQK